MPLVAFSMCLKRSRKPAIEDFQSDLSTQLADSIPSASFVGFEVHADDLTRYMWAHVAEVDGERHITQIPFSLGAAVDEIIFSADAKTDICARGVYFVLSLDLVQLAQWRHLTNS